MGWWTTLEIAHSRQSTCPALADVDGTSVFLHYRGNGWETLLSSAAMEWASPKVTPEARTLVTSLRRVLERARVRPTPSEHLDMNLQPLLAMLHVLVDSYQKPPFDLRRKARVFEGPLPMPKGQERMLLGLVDALEQCHRCASEVTLEVPSAW